MELPGAMTVRPMRPAPPSTWLPRSESVSEVICLFMSEMPDTWLNCASWPTYCDGSSGFIGSWFFSCVIISVRKSSWFRSVFLRSAALAALAEAASDSERCRTMAALTMSMSSMFQFLLALAQPQRGQQQVLGCVHDFDVVLVRARGGDHVDHLLDHVDRRRVHVAVGVGEGIARFVALRRRRLRFVDAADAHRGAVVGVLAERARLQLRAHRLEDGVARLVDLVGIAAHALGIGEIAGGGVQAHRLRRHARSRDFKCFERRHGRLLLSCP